jgi:adenine-specific DNA methylase
MKWFAPVWTDVTGQLRTKHPAPYPVEVPRRLIQMFSFARDLVVDPFAGTGTTTVAALETGRSSIAVEIEPTYVQEMRERLSKLKIKAHLTWETHEPPAMKGDGVEHLRAKILRRLTEARSHAELRLALSAAQALLATEPTTSSTG